MNVSKLIVLMFIPLLLGACSNRENSENKEQGPTGTISVSILPQKYFLEKITGDRFDVNVMIPPGFAPANYDPGPRQMQELEDSRLYFRIGRIIFEQVWMKRISDNNPELKIYDVSSGLEYIRGTEHSHEAEHAHGQLDTGVDPHIWMSVKYAPVIAKNFFSALVENYPSDSAYFRSNYQKLLNEIDSLSRTWEQERENLRGKTFLIYHPALTYLAREYEMVQMVLELEGKEPPPAHLKELVDRSKEKDIDFILVQKQFNLENAKTLAKEIGAEVVSIDPLDPDWADQMYHILSILTKQ